MDALEEGRDEVVFTDKLLEAWMWDSRNTGLPPQGTACTLARYARSDDPEAAPPESVRVLDLTDQQFVRIDRAVSKLPKALSRMVWVEYTSPAPMRSKATRMRLSYADYRGRLLAARWAVYAALQPDVERWHAALRDRVRKNA